MLLTIRTSSPPCSPLSACWRVLVAGILQLPPVPNVECCHGAPGAIFGSAGTTNALITLKPSHSLLHLSRIPPVRRYDLYYEPYFIGPTRDLPRYDERFLWVLAAALQKRKLSIGALVGVTHKPARTDTSACTLPHSPPDLSGETK